MCTNKRVLRLTPRVTRRRIVEIAGYFYAVCGMDNLMDVFKKARASTNVSLALITGRCVIHAEIRGGVDRIVNGTVLHCFASR